MQIFQITNVACKSFLCRIRKTYKCQAGLCLFKSGEHKRISFLEGQQQFQMQFCKPNSQTFYSNVLLQLSGKKSPFTKTFLREKNTKIVDGLSERKIDIGLCFFMHIIINNAPRLFFNAVLSVEKNEGKDFLNKVSSKVSDNRVVCALYFKTLSMSLNSNLN